MRARLVMRVGLVMCACFGIVGCGNESPVFPDETVPEGEGVREVANLVSTVPMTGEEAADTRPVTLFFDKIPLAVTVNDTPAVINGKQAKWTIPRNIDDGSQLLLHIKWVNPDGSQHVGAFIRLIVVHPHIDPPNVENGNIQAGDAMVDPELINRDGIWFEFDRPIRKSEFKVLTKDRADLGWNVVWDAAGRIVTLTPGIPLEHGRLYRIDYKVTDWKDNTSKLSFRFWTTHIDPPNVEDGNIQAGDAMVDPELINRDGIWFEFDRPIRKSEFKVLTEDRADLGWDVVWDAGGMIVTLIPGMPLEHGRLYRIDYKVTDWNNNIREQSFPFWTKG